MTQTLRALTTTVCPLCGEHRPLPPGITSPHFEDPAEPGIAPAEAARRVTILATWADPIQQLLAVECQSIGTGSHVGTVAAHGEFWPYAP